MITRDDFKKYEEVRSSGVTNMFDLNTVTELAGLTRYQCLDIMKYYEHFKKQYEPEMGG